MIGTTKSGKSTLSNCLIANQDDEYVDFFPTNVDAETLIPWVLVPSAFLPPNQIKIYHSSFGKKTFQSDKKDLDDFEAFVKKEYTR